MKRLLLALTLICLVQNLNAQEVVIYDDKGRNITEEVMREDDSTDMKYKEAMPVLKSSNQIVVSTINGSSIESSSSLEIGKNYYLFVVKKAEDTTLIGKSVICQIIEKRKSNISGSEGRIILRPLYVEKGSLQVPIIPNDIIRRGLNRTNFKFWTSFLIIPIFIAGSRAEIKPDEEIIMTLDM